MTVFKMYIQNCWDKNNPQEICRTCMVSKITE